MFLFEIINSNIEYQLYLNISDKISYKLLKLCRNIVKTKKIDEKDKNKIKNTIDIFEKYMALTIMYSDPSDENDLNFLHKRLEKIKLLYKKIT